MIKDIREKYNAAFTQEAYQALLTDINQQLEEPLGFRVAETPVFIDQKFKEKLIAAGDDLVTTILRKDFKELTERSIPQEWRTAHENERPHFLTFDFAVCRDENQELVPRLIELQGFPSLYGFQPELAKLFRKHFPLVDSFTPYFQQDDEQAYFELLRRTIIGNHQPHEVILLDINAHEQKTAIDFFITARHLGLEIVSLEELRQRGNKIFYTKDGKEHRVKKIYNRLIFDEVENKEEAFKNVPDLLTTDQIEWVGHPNWFYRISKYTMPFLESEFVPLTAFLSEVITYPENLSDYVLKPLFSFAGQGVIIDVTQEDLAAIKDPENWVLQKKVVYEPVVQSPDGLVKCEIRLMYLWPDGGEKPTLAINLARLSRGKMIGVRYNSNFDWVGGTVCLF
ncbi:hypothetical protein [Rufibacter latericius]|uniref:Circularly permuted type 2 ATP-grasp protein n=1 Tax=Rufibacter latericius TaxID=2487040 RepID=A0A3M9MCT2_9BACT|nr:hypothetical protein [Rufibacter latericius]RNI23015.1 hypothetical protein EFB08_19675 [Rufibacter latericius]